MEQRRVATCGYCDREMGGTECLYTHVVIDGKEYPRIRLGDDREVEVGFSDPKYYEDGVGCECATPIGGIHHVGCDQEMCPCCGGQFLGCTMDDSDCEVEEFCYFAKQEQKQPGWYFPRQYRKVTSESVRAICLHERTWEV